MYCSTYDIEDNLAMSKTWTTRTTGKVPVVSAVPDVHVFDLAMAHRGQYGLVYSGS